MSDLIPRLRALARAEHDDLSVGDEAADEIERLREALRGLLIAVDDHLTGSMGKVEDDAWELLREVSDG